MVYSQGVAVGVHYAEITIESNDPSSPYTLPVELTIPEIPCADFGFSDQDPCTAEIEFTDSTFGNPTSWLWDFGDGQTSTQQNPLHYFNTVGTFNVQLIACNNNGCDTITYQVTTTFILNYNITTTGTMEPSTPLGFQLNGANILSVQWDFGDNTATSLGNPTTHSFSDPGTYIVTANVLTSVGCVFDVVDTIVIAFDNTSIAEDLSDKVGVYPNPVRDNFTILSDVDLNGASLQIVNALGEVVDSRSIMSSEYAYNVDASGLADGTYFIKVLTKQGDYLNKKIVVEK